MPRTERRADRAARIARGRLHVELRERRHPRDLAVGHRIHRAATRQRQRIQPIARMQRVEQVEERLLVHRLRRAGDVLVTLLQRLILAARRAEPLRKLAREQGPHHGLAVLPCVLEFLAVMAEAREIQREAAIALEPHDAAHGLEVFRLAVGRQAHHLVFVAVVRKADELRDRLVEHAERMREMHAPIDADLAAAAQAPSRAGEIAEAVHRHANGLLEWRHVEGRRQMRPVMLHEFDTAVERLAQRFAQQHRHRLALRAVAQSREHQRRIGPVPQREPDLLRERRARITVDGQHRDLAQREARGLEAVAHRLGRQPRPVLYAPETLFFRGGHELAVDHQAGGRIAVVGVETEDGVQRRASCRFSLPFQSSSASSAVTSVAPSSSPVATMMRSAGSRCAVISSVERMAMAPSTGASCTPSRRTSERQRPGGTLSFKLPR